MKLDSLLATAALVILSLCASAQTAAKAPKKGATVESTADGKKSSKTAAEPKGAVTGDDAAAAKVADSVTKGPKDTVGTASENAEAAAREGPTGDFAPRPAAVTSIHPDELADFEFYAPPIRQLVRNALDLTKLNLTYTFGSADPRRGGMDCSGTIAHLLNGAGLKGVPRQSDEICEWVAERTLLHRISQADKLTHPEFTALNPGDLLFWSGTYITAARKTPVTHVMLYLGKLKKGGKHVVFGASDGRTFDGKRRTGVSVFDFSLPKPGGASTIYGYGLIPGIGTISVKPLDQSTVAAAVGAQGGGEPAKAEPPLTPEDGIKPLTKAGTAASAVGVTKAGVKGTVPAETESEAEGTGGKPIEVRRAGTASAAKEFKAASSSPQKKSKAAAKETSEGTGKKKRR